MKIITGHTPIFFIQRVFCSKIFDAAFRPFVYFRSIAHESRVIARVSTTAMSFVKIMEHSEIVTNLMGHNKPHSSMTAFITSDWTLVFLLPPCIVVKGNLVRVTYWHIIQVWLVLWYRGSPVSTVSISAIPRIVGIANRTK